MNILFVGNSFTYYHTMTGIFWELCHANGKDAAVEEITVGGWYLHQYTDPADKHGTAVPYKLRQKKWDFVVLQDQSANPAKDPEDFFAASRTLSGWAKENGAKPCFYQTWAYRDGTEKLASTGMGYREFYEALKASYEKAAAENDALIAPVGTAFYRVSLSHPEINLFEEADDYHPTTAGSFLAACEFYKTFFGEKPEKLFVPEGLTEETCRILREEA